MNNTSMTAMKRKRVVVADDLPTVRGEVMALLRESVEVVGVFSDGRAALEGAIALEPDLVVLDISMPEMSGIEVAERLDETSLQDQGRFSDGWRGFGHSENLPSRGRIRIRDQATHEQ